MGRPAESVQPNDQDTTSASVELVGRVISNETADQTKLEWIQDNITSIQEVVKTGAHDKLIYPASGTDVLRTLVAYDVTELIAIDPDDTLVPRVMAEFAAAHIPVTLTKVDETTNQLTCEIAGKPRKITFQQADAREAVADLAPNSVDILHLFLPTGAETDLTEIDVWLQKKYGQEWKMKKDTPEAQALQQTDPTAPTPDSNGKYKPVAVGIKNYLTLENYQLIRPNGFLVFNEDSISPSGRTSSSLVSMAGLVEQPIITRHPETIATSFFPSAEKLATMDRTGYVYHKAKEVSPNIITDVIQALEIRSQIDYQLMEMGRGNYEYIDLDTNQADWSATLTQLLGDHFSKVTKLSEDMLSNGVDPAEVKIYRLEQAHDLLAELRQIQAKYKEFLAKYDEVAIKVRQKQLDNAAAVTALGVIKGRNGWESTEWQIAIPFLTSIKSDTSKAELIRAFADLDLSAFDQETIATLAPLLNSDLTDGKPDQAT